jgi:hypothetical protein
LRVCFTRLSASYMVEAPQTDANTRPYLIKILKVGRRPSSSDIVLAIHFQVPAAASLAPVHRYLRGRRPSTSSQKPALARGSDHLRRRCFRERNSFEASGAINHKVPFPGSTYLIMANPVFAGEH